MFGEGRECKEQMSFDEAGSSLVGDFGEKQVNALDHIGRDTARSLMQARESARKRTSRVKDSRVAVRLVVFQAAAYGSQAATCSKCKRAAPERGCASLQHMLSLIQSAYLHGQSLTHLMKRLTYSSPTLLSLTPFKLLSQSPQYPLSQASTSFSLPFPASPTIAAILSHLCVSSSSQFSYSASTTSFSMRLTTRSATNRSCRCEPRFCRVRCKWRVLCLVGVRGEGEEEGLLRMCVKAC